MNSGNNGKIIIVVALLVIVGIFLLSNNISKKPGVSENDSSMSLYDKAREDLLMIDENEKKDFLNIDVSKYLDIYAADEQSIVFFGSSKCEICDIAKPIVQNIAYQYGLDVYYVDIAYIDDNDVEKLSQSNDIFDDSFGTPTIVLVSQGKIHDYLDGLSDRSGYLEFFRKNGFISK